MPTNLNLLKLQQLIKEKYGSQVAFAKAVGLSKQYVNDIMKGKSNPSVERLIQIANYLEVCVDDLLIR